MILIADDDEAVRNLVGDVARTEGHTVTAVADGRAAVQACFGDHYDVVITDLQMPHVTGSDVIAQMRAIGYRARFCIMSGSFVHQELPLAQIKRIFGADAALAKPFKIDQLVAVLRAMTSTDGTTN